MVYEKKIVGRCPKCGGNIVKTCKGYRCEQYRRESNMQCSNQLYTRQPKDVGFRYSRTAFRTSHNTRRLHIEGKQNLPAILELTDNGEVLMQFVIGKCPHCGGDIRVGNRAFNCSYFSDSSTKCSFSIG